ncbi:hypothetical protein WOC76_21500 [Methylocystis sp. IM3]|uniref:hypothetical protein n=1 Tax=unclassified Methylocystis TaxID=2625913 RepID=UPI0030F54365
MKYLLVILFIFSATPNAVAFPAHHSAGRPHFHAQPVSPQSTNAQTTSSYEEYLQDRREGQGLIPIANQHLRGLLFVLGGLAGPIAFLFAAP